MVITGFDKVKKTLETVVITDKALHVISPESIGRLNGTDMTSPADPNLIVTTTDMKVGTYTIAAQPTGSHVVTVTNTVVSAADTMGTITILGEDSDGNVISEVIIPVADTLVAGVLGFAVITSVTGAGWIIETTNNDTIVVGIGAVKPPTGKYIYKVTCETTAVVASETFLSGSNGPKLAALTGLVAGHVYYGRWATITMTSGECVGYYNYT